MASIYYGSWMFPEVNVSFIWDYFVHRGYRGMLHHVLKDGKKNKTPGLNTNDKTKDLMFRDLEHYIEVHGHRERHDELLQCWLDVEVDNLKPHDLFVASGYAKVGASMIERSIREPKKYSKPIATMNIIGGSDDFKPGKHFR